MDKPNSEPIIITVFDNQQHLKMTKSSINKGIFQSILIVITLFHSVKLSTSSPIIVENDPTLVLLNLLQAKMDKLEVQLEEEKDFRLAETTKQNERFDRLESEFKDKITLFMAQSAKQEEEIRLLKSKLNHETISTSNAHENKYFSNDDDDTRSSDSSPRLPPSSCRQLSTIGHYLDGIYLVANPDTNKIETVYCDFTGTTLSETLFGSVDVKFKSFHFTVQRSADFSLVDAAIPFDRVLLNEGEAMNAAAGIFTVPVDGIYHFDFTAMKDVDANVVYVYLQVNNETVGSSYATSLSSLTLSGISSSLRLKMGDEVRLFKTTGTINDNGGHYTHFSGWLV